MKITESGKPLPTAMPDVQGSEDLRQVAIDKVGVKGVTYPIRLRTPDGGEQTTVANINMYVSLPHYQKGTHMSRFLEVLNEYSNAITPSCIPKITRAIRERLDAAEAHFEASFTYFITKKAPVTGMPGMMDYKVSFASTAGDTEDFIMTVMAPATSLCPCSKEISRYGAHNQRCHIEAGVRFKGNMWIEELAQVIEQAASTQVYAVLKRPDEKYVTEDAFAHPTFVEDVVRAAAQRLERHPQISWFRVEVESFESIHCHNAFASIERTITPETQPGS